MLAFLFPLLVAARVGASAEIECESGDPEKWKPKEALVQQLEGEGWTDIRKVEVDEGCYEAYATTPEGEKVEAYFDPATLEKLLVTRRGFLLFGDRVLYEKPAPKSE